MNLVVLGDDLVAWTMAAALASTGCQVSISALTLPDEQHRDLEPELSLLLSQQYNAGRLKLGYQLSKALGKTLDLLIDAREFESFEHLYQAYIDIGLPSVIALVQPVPIGTTDQLQQHLDNLSQQETAVIFWPNFIQAGRALTSFTRVEQLLLGSTRQAAIHLIKRLMLPFNRSQDRFYVVKPQEAELAKIAINGMLATRISYMNELASLAEAKGIDIEAVRQCMGRDSRIGFQYLYPGCGFAGTALTDSLHQLHNELGAVNTQEAGLLSGVLRINEQQKDVLFQKFWRFYQADIKGKCVALWGAAYKPNTANVAGSPALHIIEVLLAHQVIVKVYDPLALQSLKKHFGSRSNIIYANTAFEAVESADALMLVTEWKEFWNVDLSRVKALMNTALLLDGRNLYDAHLLAEEGWSYSGIGRGLSI